MEQRPSEELEEGPLPKVGSGGGQNSGCFPGTMNCLSSQPTSPDPNFPLICLPNAIPGGQAPLPTLHLHLPRMELPCMLYLDRHRGQEDRRKSSVLVKAWAKPEMNRPLRQH